MEGMVTHPVADHRPEERNDPWLTSVDWPLVASRLPEMRAGTEACDEPVAFAGIDQTNMGDRGARVPGSSFDHEAGSPFRYFEL